MKKPLLYIAAFALIALHSTNALALHCPRGTSPGSDEWKNSICKNARGHAVAIQGDSRRECPRGCHINTDKRGNAVCENKGVSFYHVTGGQCPRGAEKTYDGWGNAACRFPEAEGTIAVMVP